ncbi:MAG TPA: PEP-CTERM sorting domain-containing protein [Terriglobales bacterium]|nr:PEP-CTERM sorting domain-containing protein [Terriglobales bacterium]
MLTKKILGFMILLLVVAAAIPAFADSTINVPAGPGIYSAVNSNNGFQISNDLLNGQFLNGDASHGSAYTTGTTVFAGGLNYAGTGGAYSDAGLVFFFDGGLKLGDIQSISVNSTGDPLAVNLWLDTGNNGSFFAFTPSGVFTGLNGDSYYGCGAPTITAGTSCSFLGGIGSGNPTLAALQSGAISGIDGNTNVALWVGVTHMDAGASQLADINSITVTTNSPSAVPEPASLALIGTGLAGFAARLRKRFSR